MPPRRVAVFVIVAFALGACANIADSNSIAGAIEQEEQARKTKEVRAPGAPDLERTGTAGVVVLSNGVGWQRVLGTPDVRGAVVLEVVPGSPASRSGLARGDVITRVGTTTISNHERVTVALRSRPGVQLQIAVTRGEQKLSIDLTPAVPEAVDFVRLYDDRLAAEPGDATTLFLRAQSAADSQEGLRFVNRALEIQPDLVEGLSFRGRLFWLESQAVTNEAFALEDRRRATADFQRALDIDPEATSALIARGTSMLEIRQFDDAERDALRAVRVDSSLASASLLLAAARLGAGRAREAAAPAREAVRLDPYDSSGYRVLALVFVAIGRREDAEATVRAGLTVAKDENERTALREVVEQ
jgi:PDZ domain-containing protein